MKWFKSKKKQAVLPITETDKEWVEENYRWLFSVWGYPEKGAPQYIYDKAFFPSSHLQSEPDAESLKDDICQLLNIEASDISIEFREDIRDLQQMPYGFEAPPFESEVILQPNQCQVVLASYLKKHGARLLHCLVLELINVLLYRQKLNYDSGEDSEHFVFLAAIYQGFGGILFKNLIDRGRENDQFWEEYWSFSSLVPEEVMAFALALYMDITKLQNPDWLTQLELKQRKLLQESMDYLAKNPSDLYRAEEIEAQRLLKEGYEKSKKNEFKEAIDLTRKALFLSKDSILLSDLHNNIGYYQQRLGQLEISIESFRASLSYDEANAYAFCNMGYSIIVMGRLDVAEPLTRELLEISDDPGYAHRNIALFHWKSGKFEEAEKHFQEAISHESVTDLLEFHYAQFLLELEREEEAKTMLAIALERQEPEAIAWSEKMGFCA